LASKYSLCFGNNSPNLKAIFSAIIFAFFGLVQICESASKNSCSSSFEASPSVPHLSLWERIERGLGEGWGEVSSSSSS
jgi:hypothetical protein